MRRRAFLAGSVATVSATTGCLSFSDSGSGGGTTTPDGTTPPLSGGDEAYADGFADAGAWSVHGFDARRRGHNPDTSPPTGDVGAAWLRTPIEGQRTFWTTPPVTDDSRVYVGSAEERKENQHSGFVVAFDGETGERVWRTTVAPSRIRGVARAGETILAVSDDAESTSEALVALAATDGSERWRTGKYGGNRPPAAGDTVVVPTGGAVEAFDADGNRRWRFEMPRFDAGMAAYIMRPAVALAHDRAYVSLHDGRVFSLGAK